MKDLELLLVLACVLVLLSILASKVTRRSGVPALLLFLAIGMLAGSEGLGGIYFDDAGLARSVGVVALALILFSGGLDTRWASIRPVLGRGIVLAAAGTLVTAGLVGGVAMLVTGLPALESLLLGAVVSSTDAAAVFSVLRARQVRLPAAVRDLLELESGSNDPMAVFLTVSLISLITTGDGSLPQLAASFVISAGEPVARDLVEYRVPADSPVVGRQIAKAGLPAGAEVVLLRRYDAYVVVKGSTRLRRDDVLLLLADDAALRAIDVTGELAREPSLSICERDRCA